MKLRKNDQVKVVVGKDAVSTGEFEVVSRATGETVKMSHAELLKPSA